LIGHSDGGSIALIYASKFPDKVKGLITEAAHVFTEGVTLEGIRNAVIKYKKGDLKNFLKNYHGNNTDNMFYGWSNLWLDEGFQNWNIKSSLSNIKCPLLAIQGNNDEYGTLEHINMIINEVKGLKESLIIKNCGHIPHRQAREFVLENMKMFIKKII
jgi:pimeloyl-ACP methyl ester carboxylesterase